MNVQCSGGSRFLQRRLELWRWGALWLAIRSWQRPTERIIEADTLTITWEVAQELSISHSMVVWHRSCPRTQRLPFYGSPIIKCLTACHKTNASKVGQTELQSFASSLIFTWSLVKGLPLFQASGQLFAEKMLLQQLEAENTFREFIESQSMNFYDTGINKLISHLQKYVDYNGSYFD